MTTCTPYALYCIRMTGTPHFGVFRRAASPPPPDAATASAAAAEGAALAGWLLEASLVSVGQVFLCQSAVSGALIIGGMAVSSRIAAAAACGGVQQGEG